MKEASLQEIRTTAFKLNSEGRKWHFHILTPTCKLNVGLKYTFVLECPSQNIAIVNYSDKAEKDLGQELSPLIHGNKILNKEQESTNDYRPSEKVKEMTQRALDMNKEKVEWHHHLLYPDCRFNENRPLWTLIVEDSRNGEVLDSKTEHEPLDDLKQIEMAFYAK